MKFLAGKSILVAWAFSAIAVHAEESDLLYIPFNWNPVSHSNNLLDVVGDCLRRSVFCATAAEVASVYFTGLPPGTLVLGATAMEEGGLNPHYRQEGEEFRFTLSVPEGYRICDLGIREMSAAPADGDYSPTFSVAVRDDNRVDVYSFVHRMPILVGQGARSWIDAVILLQAARIGTNSEESCYFEPGGEYSYTCKGAQGTNNGLPSCSNITFGGLAFDPPAEPVETPNYIDVYESTCGVGDNPECR